MRYEKLPKYAKNSVGLLNVHVLLEIDVAESIFGADIHDQK